MKLVINFNKYTLDFLLEPKDFLFLYFIYSNIYFYCNFTFVVLFLLKKTLKEWFSIILCMHFKFLYIEINTRKNISNNFDKY